MKSRDERRAERRKYEGDVYFEVWRSGGNPDAVGPDVVDSAFADGRYAEDVAADEVRRQRRGGRR